MELITKVLERMQQELSAEQQEKLERVLREELMDDQKHSFSNNMFLLKEFIASKTYEDCAEGTLKLYESENNKFLRWLNKPVVEVTKKDIERYLTEYKSGHHISNVTLNNMRRYVSAFFTYLEYEDLIPCNPVRKTKPVKELKTIKKPFTELEIEELRDTVDTLRDKAIIDTLNTTGMRVSELCSLNIDDVKERTAIIRGKGNKERTVYFSERAWHNVEKYIAARCDDNPALFVNLKRIGSEYKRVSTNTVENVIRSAGERKSIIAYPHKFRRTVASRAANKGMPIQEIQVLLGHSKIDTTMIYCNVDEENIRLSHARYIG